MKTKPFTYYSEKQLKQLYDELQSYNLKYNNFMLKEFNEASIEFFVYGFTRRLGILYKTLTNIYKYYPPELNKIQKSDIEDTIINLHAFYVNLYGAIDCLSKVYITEVHNIELNKSKHYNIFDTFDKSKVKRFPNASLTSENIKNKIEPYHNKYKTIEEHIRHQITHRIPIYIPDQINQNKYNDLNKELLSIDNKIKLCMNNNRFEDVILLLKKKNELFENESKTGKLFGSGITLDNSYLFPIHLQTLNDFGMVMELITIVIDEIKSK